MYEYLIPNYLFIIVKGSNKANKKCFQPFFIKFKIKHREVCTDFPC